MIYAASSKIHTMNIGERVKQARELAGLTKAELARKCDMSKQAVGQIENGSTKQPNPTNLFNIARHTGTRA